MERSRTIVFTAMVFTAMAILGGSMAAQAGPCTTQIVEVEQQIRAAMASAASGGVGAPSAPQSVGAQLHHQPTPNSVLGAERVANADGDAALQQAREADAAGNAAACTAAVARAKDIYGVP